jgi:RNA recognition motif-containing protein
MKNIIIISIALLIFSCENSESSGKKFKTEETKQKNNNSISKSNNFCIHESEAKQIVSDYLQKQVLNGSLEASWHPGFWTAEKNENGWRVEALLNYSSGIDHSTTFFVSCEGELQ